MDKNDDKKNRKVFCYQYIIIYNSFKLIAHVDQNLYKELYGLAKLKLSQKKYEKWNQYKINVEENILKKIENYNAVEK